MSQADTANAEQAELWNGRMGANWVAQQDRLDTMLRPFGDAALERAAARPGEAALDIGCGCGATTLLLAGQVGAGGAVFGVDISRPMLARAAERGAALAAPKADIGFACADAQTAPLGTARFDLAFSRFGVMFFADPAAAFANIRRAMKPGGRIVFACWRGLDENLWIKLPLQVAFAHVPPPPRPGPEDPGPFSFADADRVRRVMGQGGFVDVTLEARDIPLLLGATADLDEATDFIIDAGPLATILAEVDAPTLAAVRAALREALKPHHTADGVRMNGAIWLVEARNP